MLRWPSSCSSRARGACPDPRPPAGPRATTKCCRWTADCNPPPYLGHRDARAAQREQKRWESGEGTGDEREDPARTSEQPNVPVEPASAPEPAPAPAPAPAASRLPAAREPRAQPAAAKPRAHRAPRAAADFVVDGYLGEGEGEEELAFLVGFDHPPPPSRSGRIRKVPAYLQDSVPEAPHGFLAATARRGSGVAGSPHSAPRPRAEERRAAAEVPVPMPVHQAPPAAGAAPPHPPEGSPSVPPGQAAGVAAISDSDRPDQPPVSLALAPVLGPPEVAMPALEPTTAPVAAQAPAGPGAATSLQDEEALRQRGTWLAHAPLAGPSEQQEFAQAPANH